jgi:hypothetical protein
MVRRRVMVDFEVVGEVGLGHRRLAVYGYRIMIHHRNLKEHHEAFPISSYRRRFLSFIQLIVDSILPHTSSTIFSSLPSPFFSSHSPPDPSPPNLHKTPKMSYYFTIIGPHDNPLFTLTFGTSKAGGDGIARFRNADVARHMNQFVTHASLDIVEEVMWLSGQMCVPLPSPCPSILLSNRDGAS